MCSGAAVRDRRLSLTMVRLSFSASFLFVVYRDSFCAICIIIIVYCTSISLHWHVGTWSSVSFHVLNHYFADVVASLHGQKKRVRATFKSSIESSKSMYWHGVSLK